MILPLADSLVGPWEEYGLPGIVIGALLLLIWYGIRTWNQERIESLRAHRATVEDFREDVKHIALETTQAHKENVEKFAELQQSSQELFRELHDKTIDIITKSNPQ